MPARTTPGFFHKSGKSRITGFEAISFGAELKCEAFFFSDHNHGRPTRRNLRGALQDFLPAGRTRTYFKCGHGRKVNLRHTVEGGCALRRCLDFSRHNLRLSV